MARAPRSNWANIVLTAGLAATVSALGGFANETFRSEHERSMQRCEIAAQLLQDETPNPYLSDTMHRREALLSARRLERCLKGERS